MAILLDYTLGAAMYLYFGVILDSILIVSTSNTEDYMNLISGLPLLAFTCINFIGSWSRKTKKDRGYIAADASMLSLMSLMYTIVIMFKLENTHWLVIILMAVCGARAIAIIVINEPSLTNAKTRYMRIYVDPCIKNDIIHASEEIHSDIQIIYNFMITFLIDSFVSILIAISVYSDLDTMGVSLVFYISVTCIDLLTTIGFTTRSPSIALIACLIVVFNKSPIFRFLLSIKGFALLGYSVNYLLFQRNNGVLTNTNETHETPLMTENDVQKTPKVDTVVRFNKNKPSQVTIVTNYN